MTESNRVDLQAQVAALQARVAELEAANAERELAADYRRMAEVAPAMLWLSDKDGACTFVNQTWQAFTGRTLDQELGFGSAEGIHPDDVDHFLNSYQAAYRNRERLQSEYRLRRADGEYRWVLDTGVPIYTAAGEFAGYIGTAIDITERKQAEDALRESEARFRAMFETTPVGITISQGGRVVAINPALTQMTGYTLEDLQHMSHADYVHPDDIAKLRAAVSDLLQHDGENHFSLEKRMFRKDGSMIWVRMTASLGQDEHNTSIVVVEDITRRKEAEQQALALAVEKERMRVLADFVRDAGHDFRTPLSTLNTSIYLAERGATQEQRQRHFNVLREQVSHLEKLVDGLMTMSRLDSDTPLNMNPLHIDTLLREIVTEMCDRVRKEGTEHTITLDLPDSAPLITGDSVELHRALSQLVDNAIRFSRPGGRIAVKMELSAQEEVCVTVRDDGIGIDPEDLPRIFQRFYRADKARSVAGVGLGLSIARKVIERHSGSIDVESAPGEGSLFTVRLPLTTSVSSDAPKHKEHR